MIDKEFDDLLNRYETMRGQGGRDYFDVDDFLDIIDWYMLEERDADAEDAISLALYFHPSNPELLLMKARLCLFRNDFQRAADIVATLSNACDYPDYFLVTSELLLHDSHPEEAILQLEKALLLTENDPEVYASAINLLCRYEQNEEAEKWMRRALRRWPDDPAVMDAAALCLSLLDRPEEAIAICNRLIDQDPYNARSWGVLGDIYHDAGDFTHALEAYGYVKAIQPDETFSDQNMADCHFAVGNYSAARDLYARVVEKGHEDPSYALGRLALCEANLGNNDEFVRLLHIIRNNDTQD